MMEAKAVEKHMEEEHMEDAAQKYDKYADFEQLFNDGPDESMTGLAGRLWDTKQQEKKAKEVYKGLKAERMEMEESLNIQMENVGINSFRTEDATFYTKQSWYANVAKIDQPRFFGWLREHDFGDLVYETVNARTLSAFAKDRQIEGGDLPDYLNVTVKKTVGMRKK